MGGRRFERRFMRDSGQLMLDEQAQRLADEVYSSLDPIELPIEPVEPNCIAFINLRSCTPIEKGHESVDDDLGL